MGGGGAGGMTVLAVDDEEHALAELAFLLSAEDSVETVLTASNATETLRILNECHGRTEVDAVFLDVRMPGLDGLELAKVFMSMAAPPPVVFVTAHEDRAVDAYEVGAVDYLLKPLRSERLGASLDRIQAIRPVPEEPGALDAFIEEIIPIELAGTTKLVPRSEIRYVEAHGDYARLHTLESSHLVRIPIGVLEDRWYEAGFVRIHRSYLVELSLVTAMRLGGSGHIVTLGRGQEAVELPVSRRHVREVRQRLRGSWRESG